MSVKRNFVSNQLSGILKNEGLATDEPIFNEFNDYLKTLGLDVAASTYISKNDIILGKPSSIDIYLCSTTNFKINKHDNNWDSQYKYTNEIISKWRYLFKKYNYPEDSIAEQVYVFIYDLE